MYPQVPGDQAAQMLSNSMKPIAANLTSTETNTATSNNINTINSFDSFFNNKNNAGNNNEALGAYYEALKEQYQKLSNEYDGLVLNDYSKPGAFFRPWSAEQYRQNMQKLKNERDKTYELLRNAEAQRFQHAANSESIKNRYILEKEALKKIGINNPYFMLRNGTLPNNINLSSNLSGGSYKPQYKSTEIPDAWKGMGKLFKMILPILLMGAKAATAVS